MCINMNNNKNIKIVTSITIATIIGKVLGIVKDSLISHYYGASNETDAFFLALSIPTILLGVFTASTDSAIIPQYTRIMRTESKEKADRLFFSIVNSILLVCVFVCVLILLFPEIFVKIFAPGFDNVAIWRASEYLSFFSSVGVFHMLYCFLCTYNAVYKRSNIRAILSLFTNFIVVFTLIIIKDAGLYYLAITFLLSNVICGLLPIAEMKKIGFTYFGKIDYKNSEYRRFWVLFIPIMSCALLNDIQQYIDKNLCSGFEGGISYLNYGSKFVNIFDSVLVVGIGVVLLPILSNINVKNDKKEFSKISSKLTRYLLEVLVPFFVILFAVPTPLIMLLFGGGQFDRTSINEVSAVLKAYSALIVFMPIKTIFSKLFYSKEMNNIPFTLSAIAVGINILLSSILKEFIGVQGVALATTIASVIEIVAFVIIIKKRIQWDRSEINITVIGKIIFPIILSICLINLLDRLWKNYLVNLVICSFVIFVIFISWYYIVFREDIMYIFSKMKSLIIR